MDLSVQLGAARYELIDLSNRISNETSDLELNRHEIEYVDHRATVAQLDAAGVCPAELWPGGIGAAVENVTLSSHSGTHVDAPYHYGPESGGRPATRIDELPLRWCIGDGVLLDMSHKEIGEGIDEADVRRELERIGHELKAFDIVLVRTDASQRFGAPGYANEQPGLRRSATKWLVSQGVRLIGIDAWGLDRPLNVMVEEARAGDVDQLWESHRFGREREYAQIEKLANLDRLPVSHGFIVVAFPVLLAHASAGWSRVVALVPT